jgi:nitroreductase/NAD-dependent dihydropyrimidine dehydrogenase PreA subunit
MSLFTINPDTCLRDGLCVAECPSYIIETQEEGCPPVPVPWAEETCINCGHCVAVCPVGALSLNTMSPEECADVRPDLLPAWPQVEHLLRTRRSIRSFEDRPVPPADVERLIEVATYAPSGSNSQPVEWLVIYDTGLVRRLAPMMRDVLLRAWCVPRYNRIFTLARDQGYDVVCRGAPHIIFALTPPGAERHAAISVTYLELAAYSMGLAACWCGFATGAVGASPELQAVIGLPEGRTAAAALLVGYPRYTYQRIPLRNPARVAWR